MLDKSLFICYSTTNYAKLTNLCLDSLNCINVKNINHKIDNPSPDLLKNTGFQTEIWYYSVRNKIKHLIDVLEQYDSLSNIKYFIFSDCDIIYIKKNINEWYNLEKVILDNDKDIFFMQEGCSYRVNTGFFVIKNNKNIRNIINFFIEVLQIFDKTCNSTIPYGDQSIINNIKHKLNYGVIPNEYVVFGIYIFNKNKSLLHHAVCCNNIDEKILQINKIKENFKC